MYYNDTLDVVVNDQYHSLGSVFIETSVDQGVKENLDVAIRRLLFSFRLENLAQVSSKMAVMWKKASPAR